MDKPSSVKIGPHIWEIHYDADEIQRLSTAKYDVPGNLLGYTEKLKLIIYIEPSLAPSLMRETLIHEMLHAMFFVHALDPHVDDDKDFDNEEAFIQTATAPLLSLLLENPQVFAWINSEERN